jgi:hypothetical protein
VFITTTDIFPSGLIKAVESNWLLLGEQAILFAPGRTNLSLARLLGP